MSFSLKWLSKICSHDFANMLRASKNNVDLVFGFHSHPHHSVGHLRMHVLLHDFDFRTCSTLEHDWKTIPFGAVEDVLDEEAEPKVPGGWPLQWNGTGGHVLHFNVS
ncbi:hypothetical protein PLEOSDRAFT_168089 [Pleurotus ostreatus PC15]|uniref:Uncharacterized protein n=1 Tax=Pleurotus ostreatus (strain PC15) TaxID=1137138 RepID=A0A067NLT7_PLEO1|nr:hypothetical protein PLEOSDRAFT_168089 [Pleurotus ostreatus PC15]